MSSDQNTTYITPGDLPAGLQSKGPVKPTILAFHGSGSNATVHTVQLARLARLIKPYVDVESMQAPFPSPAGPGVLPFFDGCGPFFRWLPSSEKVSVSAMHAGTSTSSLAPEVESLVRTTVQRINARGSRVVGLIGFSQGTKVVAGLLRASEIVRERGEHSPNSDWCDFRFGISVCGSYPPGLVPRGVVAVADGEDVWEKKITSPTLHVQGAQDEWVWAGQGLIERHYEVGEGMSEVVQWDIGHHYPVEAEQSERIAEWMLGVLKKLEGEKDGR